MGSASPSKSRQSAWRFAVSTTGRCRTNVESLHYVAPHLLCLIHQLDRGVAVRRAGVRQQLCQGLARKASACRVDSPRLTPCFPPIGEHLLCTRLYFVFWSHRVLWHTSHDGIAAHLIGQQCGTPQWRAWNGQCNATPCILLGARLARPASSKRG